MYAFLTQPRNNATHDQTNASANSGKASPSSGSNSPNGNTNDNANASANAVAFGSTNSSSDPKLLSEGKDLKENNAPAVVLLAPAPTGSSSTPTATAEALPSATGSSLPPSASTNNILASMTTFEISSDPAGPSPPATTSNNGIPATPNSATTSEANAPEAPPSIPLKKTDSCRKGALDQNAIEGLMTMHVKKMRKNLFKPSKSTYYMVADERKPVLEIYSNETKTELVYLLSLHQALLCFESDDANIVMEKCFCVEVKTWKKKNAVYLKTQRFIFYEEDQIRMLLWVKCIHLAIKNSTKVEMERDLFRLSMMTTASAVSDQAFSDDDVDRETTEYEDQQQPVQQQQQQQRGKSSSPLTETSTISSTTAPTTAAAPTNTFRGSARERINQMFLSPRGNQKSIANMLSSSVSQPAASAPPNSSSQPVGSTPGNSPSPPQQSAAETLLAPTLALLHAAMEKKSNGQGGLPSIPEKNTTTPAAAAFVSTSSSISSSNDDSSTLRSGSQKEKSGGFHFSPKIINNFQQAAKIPIKGLHIGGKHNNSNSNNAQDRAGGSSSSTSSREPISFINSTDGSDAFDDEPTHSRPNQESLFQLVRRKSLARLQAALQAQQSQNHAASTGPNSGTSASAFTVVTWRFAFLMLTCLAGWWQTSVFLPLAAAGVLRGFTLGDDFEMTAVLSVLLFWLSEWNLALGLCTSCGLLYSWTFSDYKNSQRRRRVEIADKLLAEEKLNFANVGIPNWLRQPDVDRVEWVNRVLIQSWPYMKIAIRNTLMDSLNPLLDAQKPVFISSLGFVRIDLGNKVPHISGVKYVSASTSTEEATIDIEVRVVTDKTFVAELKMASPVGAAALVSLRDLFIVGTLRLSFTPMATYWPCFSGLRLCFINQPVVDFSLKAAKINIANVPFASEWLHTFLHDLLINYFVWPKVADIPLWDPDPCVFSGSTMTNCATSVVSSSLAAFCAATPSTTPILDRGGSTLNATTIGPSTNLPTSPSK